MIEITCPVKFYDKNAFGLYNVCGNVAEMIDVEGIAMGGGWEDTGYNVRVESEIKFEKSSKNIGFRPVMVKKN